MHSNYKQAQAAPRCQYVRLNDQRCTQPALKDQVFCRFHDLVDHPLADSRLIPFVEDATTLQLALMQVIKSLQLGKLDRRTAGTILYALQIAASNLKHFSEEVGHPFAQPAARKTKKEQQEEKVLAGPSLAEILLERLDLVDPEQPDPPVILRDDAASRATAASDSKGLVSPPPLSAPSGVKEVQPGGTIDRLEACDASLGISSTLLAFPWDTWENRGGVRRHPANFARAARSGSGRRDRGRGGRRKTRRGFRR